MHLLSTAVVGGLLASTVSADAIAGFNSGSTFLDGKAKQKSDFLNEFKTAANLKGAPTSFNAVRLYTMVQAGTTNTPISAIEAALETNTKLLLGIWASQTSTIKNDLDALNTAINNYGQKFADLVIGISVGSEDLYRNSATGVANKAGVGADPSVVANFMGQVKSAISNTVLSKALVGHVDTWDVWGNSSNSAVLAASQFVGVDAYPYYESNRGDNSIGNAVPLWNEAYQAVLAAAGPKKPVWVTETGWPVSGPSWGKGVPSVANAKQYWDDIGCTLFGKTNVFWFTLDDNNPEDKAQFAITENLSTTPQFNLTCPAVKASTGSSSSSTSTSQTSSSSGTTGADDSNGTSSGVSGSSGSSGTAGSSGTTGTSGSAGTGSSNTSSSPSSSSSGSATGAAGMMLPSLFSAVALAAVAAVFAF